MSICYIFLSTKYYGGLAVDNAWVYSPGGSPKNKDMFYTPMVGSTTINVMVLKSRSSLSHWLFVRYSKAQHKRLKINHRICKCNILYPPNINIAKEMKI